MEDSGLRHSLFSILGAQELLVWHRAQITLNQTADMNVEFLMSSTGLLSNIAIDDITIRSGSCGEYHQCYLFSVPSVLIIFCVNFILCCI